MFDTLEILNRVSKGLEEELSEHPFLIVNESELQAYLQQRLLQAFPNEPALTLQEGVIDRRPNCPKICRRVYREAKIRPGKSAEPDLIVLENRTQVIEPKKNGAPSRF